MDLGAVLIAVTGVAGTLGGALLTQRSADRTKRRELELTQTFEVARENRELRRSSYTALHRDARQYATALSRHLYVMRDGTPGPDNVQALEDAKDAYRDCWSEALMIAADTVVAPAAAVNGALNSVYGHVKRLEQGSPRPGETLASAAASQHALWDPIHAMRAAMRRDLGISTDQAPAPEPAANPAEPPSPPAHERDFPQP